jgi:hypothetical protein
MGNFLMFAPADLKLIFQKKTIAHDVSISLTSIT